NSPYVQKLESKLLGKNRFINTLQQMMKAVEEADDSELSSWLGDIVKVLYKKTDNKFDNILKTTVKIAEKLYKDIWYELGASEVSKLLSGLIKFKWEINLARKEEFPQVLRSLIAGSKHFKNNNRSNITIGRPEDLAFLKFDLVILCDFSNE